MNVLKSFRQPLVCRILAFFLLAGVWSGLLLPTGVYALTTGPSQPEVQSFEPIGTTQMVDPFTGDFSYNIPLLDVGGYPINISYHSGVTMEQEASSVGLGWNINPGVVGRSLNAIPDDFKGEKIKYTNNFKPMVGVNVGYDRQSASGVEKIVKSTSSKEVFGISLSTITNDVTKELLTKGYNWGVDIQYDNYRGVGYTVSGGGFNEAARFPWVRPGISLSSFEGLDLTAGISFDFTLLKKEMDEVSYTGGITLGAGLKLGSRTGQSDISFNAGVFRGLKVETTNVDHKFNSEGFTTTNTTYVSHNKESIYNGGFSFLNNAPSFYPSGGQNTRSAAYQFSLKAGKENEGKYKYNKARASVSYYGLDENVIERFSYGTMYLDAEETASEKGTSPNVLDYNHVPAKNPQLNKFTSYIGQASGGEDTYIMSGQGASGAFKPRLGRVGMFHPPKETRRNYPSGDRHLELGIKKMTKVGVDVRYVYSNGLGGGWRKDKGNEATGNFYFSQNARNSPYESVYFTNNGERLGDPGSFLHQLNYFTPINFALEKRSEYSLREANDYITGQFAGLPSNTGVKREERQVRNQVWSHLVASEVETYGLTKQKNPNAAPHHMAEITVTQEDGSRYVYGQALYNIKHKEVTFNKESADTSKTSLPLSPGTYTSQDNSINNNNGKDHIYNAKEIPAYSHSYYLTAVLSADYVDVDNNGPTPNDLGDYTLFEYEKAYENYKWRTPYTTVENKGNAYRGLDCIEEDDKVSYIYGEKEIWYLKEVKSKLQKAVFTYDKTGRKDALEAKGENGGKGTRALWKLDKIELFSLTEHVLAQGTTPVLIKTVHFAYSYDLCGNVPNNTGTNSGIPHPLDENLDQNNKKGKLTLHKIWFTYQDSKLGEQSPYVFLYDQQNNPDYDPADIDRWGYFKENEVNGRYNYEFPYAEQNPAKADDYARSWNLSTIQLPSGGEIQVEYEADNYAYVQNKKAGQMHQILGFGKTAADYDKDDSPGIINQMYTDEPHLYMFVALSDEVSSAEDFKKRYLTDHTGQPLKDLYFKVLTNLNKKTTPGGMKYGYVEGFVDIENSGITNNPKVGWIKLQELDKNRFGDKKLNPISKAIWQYARLNTPFYINPGSDFISDPDNINAGNITLNGLLALIPETVKLFQGFHTEMMQGQFGQVIVPHRSIVRLFNPTNSKYGGGSRVRKLSFTDNWSQFKSGNLSETYITSYEYTMEDGSSSGVALNEPMIGAEENSLLYPKKFKEENPLAKPNELYDLEPVGMHMYPSASVGYRRVVIKNLYPQDLSNPSQTITRHADGYQVYEFYTAKEFPTRSEATLINRQLRGTASENQGTQLGAKFLGMFGHDLRGVVATQGFQVIQNDMHGKLRSMGVYSATSDLPTSKTEHFYKIEANGRPYNTELLPGRDDVKLNNEVTVLKPDGTFENRIIGVEANITVETEEQRDVNLVAGLDINLDVGSTPGPWFMIVPIPRYKRSISYKRVATVNKVITQSGILIRTVQTKGQAKTTSENMAFDSETGTVLLTKVNNFFNDPVYNLTYPAHWAYDGMGQSYKNAGLEFDFVVDNGLGYITNPEVGKLLAKGDELAIAGTNARYWILHVTEDTYLGSPATVIGVIDEAGRTMYNGIKQAKILRSGRRNMQGLAIAGVQSLGNPLNTSTGKFGGESDFSEVISTSAVEYDEKWQTFMGFKEIPYDCEAPPRVRDGNCSEGIPFMVNYNYLLDLSLGPLCLSTAGRQNTVTPICDDLVNGPPECPATAPFRRVPANPDPSYKTFPDESDGFEIDDAKPADLDLIFRKAEPEYFWETEKQWAWNQLLHPGDKGKGPSALSDLFYPEQRAKTAAFPSCDGLITHMMYKEGTSAGGLVNLPYVAFKFYSAGPVEFCKDVYVFQYESDRAIMKDRDQVKNKLETLEKYDVIGGKDYACYKVVFPEFPQIKAYRWTTCPNCDPPPAGSGGSVSGGAQAGGGTPGPGGSGGGGSGGAIYDGDNPFLLGIYGNWRPKRSYVYYDVRNNSEKRTQTNTSGFNSTNIRKDGTMSNFRIFWNPPATPTAFWTKPGDLGTLSNPWTWNQESDQVHPVGYEVQTRDKMGIFSSAYHSPVNFQPYFVVNNSNLKNAVGEGFEDYWKFYFDADCDDENVTLNRKYISETELEAMRHSSFQWNIWTAFTPYAYVVNDQAHTGKKALKISMQHEPGANTLDLSNQTPGQLKLKVENPDNLTRVNWMYFRIGNEDLLDRFNPDKEEFTVSFWYKKEGSSDLQIRVAGATVTPVLPAMANPIEGWYKREYRVKYTSSPGGEMELEFLTNGTVYLDDIRVHPTKAVMKTFTYQPGTLRVSSMSDENNFATFFEYDAEGNLVRTKRETEKGIYTISENRKNIRRVEP